MISWLGQAASCATAEVLPPDYMAREDAAYLPGIAPETPAAPERRANPLVPITLATVVIAVIALFNKAA